MLIAVISDTHKMDRYINIAKEYIQEADILIHLGDNSDDIDKLGEGFKGNIYCVICWEITQNIVTLQKQSLVLCGCRF